MSLPSRCNAKQRYQFEITRFTFRFSKQEGISNIRPHYVINIYEFLQFENLHTPSRQKQHFDSFFFVY